MNKKEFSTFFLSPEEKQLYQEYKAIQTYGVPYCTNPYKLKDGHLVACRKCPCCQEKNKLHWISRCAFEFWYCKKGEFLTLTFDDAHLNNTSYSVVQAFFKRLRSYFKTSFKYFVAYENGEKTFRPHYHVLLFGFERPDMDSKEFNVALSNIWRNGFVDARPMDLRTIPYVVGYVNKKRDNYFHWYTKEQKKENRELPFVPARQPFYSVSRGLGFRYVFENSEHIKEILRKGYIQIGQGRYQVPVAYINKLRDSWMLMYELDDYEAQKLLYNSDNSDFLQLNDDELKALITTDFGFLRVYIDNYKRLKYNNAYNTFMNKRKGKS